EVIEMNEMVNHIHVLVSIPPKMSVSEYMGIQKGKTAIKLFEKKRYLREKPYWGNCFWARGYFVSTVGLDKEKIKRYIKYQEEQEKKQEADDRNYKLF
ncbi:MAG TPA: IS200/IS605 family transposase, partial [Bacteroidia bacterium]